jgi:hypothetical protein
MVPQENVNWSSSVFLVVKDVIWSSRVFCWKLFFMHHDVVASNAH